eukprot:NODE_1031_length_1310_cov_114.716891_g850_i0.p2 GENE.NODE_1031_length_1310_cov_114.716891_g850_i0~~NODE_1031_length_1310_cov_114.716891_g850_i0.p2  ORF type:complete len:168 (+),score=39.55 NODE_1031_length_1310_cov_114.716891_g850_i0:299-802(+)
MGWGGTNPQVAGADPNTPHNAPELLRRAELVAVNASTVRTWAGLSTSCRSVRATVDRSDPSLLVITGDTNPSPSDVCSGDSGGPLVRRELRSPAGEVLVGVVSFGFSCGRPRMPSFHTSVFGHLVWITTTMSQTPPLCPGPSGLSCGEYARFSSEQSIRTDGAAVCG